MEYVHKFINLGQIFKVNNENQTAEINLRIRLGWMAFGRLSYVLKNRRIPLQLRRRVYNTCIISVLRYGPQTLIYSRKNIERLKKAQNAMERAMLGITLKDRKRNS